MNVQDERDLRESLTGLLEDVTPRPAPVVGAVHQGMRIKLRRWVSAAAVVAVIAAGAGIAPTLLRAHTSTPPMSKLKQRHYKVVALPLGAKARSGVIAEGITDGKHWKVVASGSKPYPGFQVTGGVGLGGLFTEPTPTGWPVNTEAQTSNSSRGFSSVVGTVSPDVAGVSVSLPNGDLLSLTPVLWKGNRWIGMVLPGGVPIVRAIAYSAKGAEIAYSVPFGATGLDVWWHPGQAGPRRVIKAVGSGVVDGLRWKEQAAFGPWGYCYTFGNGSGCSSSTKNPEDLQPGKLFSGFTCSPVDGSSEAGPFEGVDTVAPDIARVVLRYSDGTSASFRTVAVDGGRSVGYSIPKHADVVRTVAYDSSGNVVGTTSGAPMQC